ncbi:MAG: hypothetical protein Q9227_000694 [Pyrenula ochraceoflavens]
MLNTLFPSVLAAILLVNNALAAPISDDECTVDTSSSVSDVALAAASSTAASADPTSSGVNPPSGTAASTGSLPSATGSGSLSNSTTSAPSAPGSTTLPSIPTSCQVSAFSALSAAVSSCTALSLNSLTVPADTTLDLTKLQKGATVVFEGNTSFTFSSSMTDDLIKASGTGITITGAPGHVIDGNGGAWWDGQGSNGGVDKPDHFFTLSKVTGNSVLSNLNIKNWPVHCFSITNCADLTISGLTLDNSAGDAPNAASGGKAAAHNSDGFDLSSSNNVLLTDTSVRNQDDCVAVTSGDGVTVQNMNCVGGHGLSIGSIGGKSNNDVSNILFQNSVISNSENGARIKTNSGTTGSVSNITYSNIALSGITTYGIDIQQDYLNGGPTGTPTNGVTIDGVTMSNVTGTVAKGKDYYILCGDGSCSNFVFEDVSVTGGSGDSCNFQPTGGFTC